MDTKASSRWRRLLRYRIAYKRIIPPEARVDPLLFPEEEFPVFCSTCNYLLRGLPENRCPECGREFDPGRLLVAQYVLEYGKRRWRGVSKWAWRTWFAAIALAILAELLVWFQGWIGRRNPNLYLTAPAYWFKVFSVLMVALCIGALVLGLVSGWLFLRWTLASRRKRRQVFEAIQEGSHGGL